MKPKVISPPPAVLLVGNFLSQRQPYRCVCEDLAEQLRARGHKVITTSSYGGRLARLADILWTIWSRRREYGAAQLDVYSGPAFVAAEAAAGALTALGKPFILTLHGGRLPEFARRWPRRVTRLLRAAAAVTTPSGFLFEAMQPYRRDLRLLPNGVNLAGLRFRLREGATPRLVWLRAFHAIYQPELALEAAARLRRTFPELKLLLVGPDKGDGTLARVRRLTGTLGLNGAVELVPGVPKHQVATVLDHGDIFLNTTTVDNVPISVLEALAAGLCVVSTKVGGIPYLLEPEHDALLVPPGDAAAMADAVARLLTDPVLAARLSRQGHLKASRFDWAEVMPRWEALFQEVAEDISPV